MNGQEDGIPPEQGGQLIGTSSVCLFVCCFALFAVLHLGIGRIRQLGRWERILVPHRQFAAALFGFLSMNGFEDLWIFERKKG